MATHGVMCARPHYAVVWHGSWMHIIWRINTWSRNPWLGSRQHLCPCLHGCMGACLHRMSYPLSVATALPHACMAMFHVSAPNVHISHHHHGPLQYYHPLLFPFQAGNHAVLELFLKKNPALVFARSQEDGGTPWHYAAQVCGEGGGDTYIYCSWPATKATFLCVPATLYRRRATPRFWSCSLWSLVMARSPTPLTQCPGRGGLGGGGGHSKVMVPSPMPLTRSPG